MITRTLPVISPFPDFSIVESLSHKHLSLISCQPLFYDIETTGLSSATSYCYLIGCIYYKDHQWYLNQWFAETPNEETDILQAFSAFSNSFSHTIQYNGTKFDNPFLSARAVLHQLEMPVLTFPSLDLFTKLKPLKKFLKLEHMKQSDLETFLNLSSRKFADGRRCIKCYKDYLKKPSSDILEELLGHNLEDLCGLGSIFYMLAYLQLFTHDYEIEHIDFGNADHMIFHLKLAFPVPEDISYSGTDVYFTAFAKHARLLVTSSNGKYKMYYPNYKDYSYLPAEDTAIPKSLSSYIDKSLIKPARPETCYTWFEVTDKFKNDITVQKKYLHNLLEFFFHLK